ncbi:MAG TPA: META domain-containing protein [Prolixibacteraceae bacterium]|nr:META domain-containing protein [Prolixibacteraceae bacterium]
MKAIFYVLALFGAFTLMGSCQEEIVAGDDDLFHTWEATEFMSLESVAYPRNEGSAVLLTFKRDGSYHLRLDVNSCMGSYETGDSASIHIESAGCTKMCCDSPFSVKLSEMLTKVTSYQIEDDTLQLHVPGWGYVELERRE